MLILSLQVIVRFPQPASRSSLALALALSALSRLVPTKACTSVRATNTHTSLDSRELLGDVRTARGRSHVHLRALVPLNALHPLRAQYYLSARSSVGFLPVAPTIAKIPSFPSTRSGCTHRYHSTRSLVVSGHVHNSRTSKKRHRGPSLTCCVHAHVCRSLAPRASTMRT